jgi:hypothetical protein
MRLSVEHGRSIHSTLFVDTLDGSVTDTVTPHAHDAFASSSPAGITASTCPLHFGQ